MEKENLDIKECTFKPKISNSKGKTSQKQKIVLKNPLKQRKNNNASNYTSKLTSNMPTDRMIGSNLMSV